MSVGPGWYTDPYAQAELRWWDGTQWTSAVESPSVASAAVAAPAPFATATTTLPSYGSPASPPPGFAPTATLAPPAPPVDFSSGTIAGSGGAMKKPVPTPLVLGVVGALVLAGGGYFLFGRGSSSKPVAAAPVQHHATSAPAAPTNPITAAQGILLTIADFPEGFQSIGSATSSSNTSDDEPTDAAMKKCVGAQDVPYAEVDSPAFTKGESLVVMSSVQTFTTVGLAKTDFNGVLSPATPRCLTSALQDEVSHEVAGAAVNVTVSPAHSAADQTAAIVATITASQDGVTKKRFVSIIGARVGAREVAVTAIADGTPVSQPLLLKLRDAMIVRARGTAAASPVGPITSAAAGNLSEADANVKASLRNAANAEEIYFTDNGQYTKDIRVLEANSFKPEPGVTVVISRVGADAYCITGKSAATKHTWTYDSHKGGIQPVDQPC
ncbi:DUF2510 domain-containing protein [Humibacter sp.]|uniref:DUF2510 domain-containing protein n=1 Tax=Humibacter sp. TaxID=1940291 RepID=UPI002C3FC9A7|nr:DUF2510 domain-containing protein [Humibacter sp.]HVX08518.1 DUF2510 domain-containing protein [Humibacter sp.]